MASSFQEGQAAPRALAREPPAGTLALSKPTLNTLPAPQRADKGGAPATRTEIGAAGGGQESAGDAWGIGRGRRQGFTRRGLLQVAR
jgi:hypothetical protein